MSTDPRVTELSERVMLIVGTFNFFVELITYCCLGGAAVWRRTRDRKVTGSTPGRGVIKSTRSTQPSIPPGMALVRRGAFTRVGWQVTLCDPIWQVTSRSFEMGFPNFP